MLSQLFLEDGHFALGLIAALVFLAIFWLEYDAWRERPSWKELLKTLGFLVLALAFLIYATVIEQSAFGQSVFGRSAELISFIGRVIGYLLLAAGQWLDPLQAVPQTEGITTPGETSPNNAANRPLVRMAAIVTSTALAAVVRLSATLGAAAVAFLYFRRTTKGLERHLKPVALAFSGLVLFEILALADLGQSSSNIIIAQWTAPFGPLWIVRQLLLVIVIAILTRWVWAYLVTRIRNQLFMIFTTATMVIFLLTTATFSYLLLANLRTESLKNLTIAAKVLDYAVTSQKAETAALAGSLATNPTLTGEVNTKDRTALQTLTTSYLADKKISTLTVTDADGQVLMRGDDPSRFGDSISSDPLIARALIGTAATSVTTRDRVVAPVVTIQSIAPLRTDNRTIIGTVIVGVDLTNDFVDGIKKATSLDSAIYAGAVRSATTFTAADGRSRLIGAKETNGQVTTAVLKNGQTYAGNDQVFNTPYLTVFEPLRDVDNVPIGMFFVGTPQLTSLQAAGRSIELTFVVAVLLVLISTFPIYLIARMIAKQVS